MVLYTLEHERNEALGVKATLLLFAFLKVFIGAPVAEEASDESWVTVNGLDDHLDEVLKELIYKVDMALAHKEISTEEFEEA